MRIREFFDERMQAIHSDVLKMGAISNDMVQRAVDALVHGDALAAARVKDMDQEVDQLEVQTIRQTVTLAMQESPVAGDFRTILVTLGVVGELEKVADEAVKLSKLVALLGSPFPAELRVAFVELSLRAREAIAAALRLYIEYSLDTMKEIKEFERQADLAYHDARSSIFEMIERQPDQAAYFVRVIDAFHFLERVTDRAREISVRIRLHNSPPQPDEAGIHHIS